MTWVLALIFAVAGFAMLALVMDRHRSHVWPRDLPAHQRVLLRAAGLLGICASLLSCVALLGWSTGLVAWTGLLSTAALVVVLSLTYLPKRYGPVSARRTHATTCQPSRQVQETGE